MTQEKQSVFAILSAIDCNGRTEIKESKWTDKKDVEHKVQLTYLSWAWAWHICKKHFPDAYYTIYETPEGRPYFDDGRTAWVKTGVTIDGLEHIEYLPIMDHRNASIPVNQLTSFDMNKAIQRSLTKAIARHGLGLYIYAGEDLPDALDESKREEVNEAVKVSRPRQNRTKPAEGSTAQAKEKKPLPERGSEEWNTWVKAVATDWHQKSTGRSAIAVFCDLFITNDEAMADLQEDAFKYNLDHPKTQQVQA